MNTVLRGYLVLTRPANLPTAIADSIAGMTIAGLFGSVAANSFFEINTIFPCILLPLASVLLYAGGVVLNDVFDASLDAIERPERPIPSGVVAKKNAAIFGITLLALGVVSASLVGLLSGIIAAVLALAIVSYDAWSKNNATLGPLNMGFCRGLNLILGMSVFGMLTYWWYAVIPIVYIAAITLISRGEVHGNNKKHIIFAGVLYASVILGVISILFFNALHMVAAIPFLLFFAIMVYIPLIKAYQLNSPARIKKAVIAGVLSLILLDASLAVGFSSWWVGLAVVGLLPLSMALSKLFAVT